MNDDTLFDFTHRCIYEAADILRTEATFAPFARALKTDGSVERFACDDTDERSCYTRLLARLRAEVGMDDIDAAALVADVTIPAQYDPVSPTGIRVHLEEKAKRHKKVSARLLYVPYDKAGGEVILHPPISVGMPMEIYAP